MLADGLFGKRVERSRIDLIDLGNEIRRAFLERTFIEMKPKVASRKICQDGMSARLSAARFPAALETKVREV